MTAPALLRRKESLSVIIPAYNEADRLPAAVETVSAYCRERFDSYEIIVVDDGSTDRTREILASMQQKEGRLRFQSLPANSGKGAAVRAGMMLAQSDLLLMCDADMSAPIGEMDKLIPWVDEGFPVVIGSRAVKESRIVRQPLYRHSMGKFFGLMARVLVIGGVRDPQCGFKLFIREAARDIFQRSCINRFAFDVEVLFLAGRLGYPIKETGIFWKHAAGSSVRLVRDSVRMALDLLRIRWHATMGRYGRL